MDPSFLRTEHCASAFDRMFWSFVFSIVDLKVGLDNVHIDLLPDVIGWLIMASSLGRIQELSPAVEMLRKLSYWLIALSIFFLIEIRMDTGAWAWISWLVGLAAGILTLVLIWKLCGLIMDMASELDDAGTRRQADLCRKFYVAYAVLGTLATLAAFAMPPLAVVVLVVAIPAMIVIVFLLMGLMKRTATMCRAA